MQILPEDTLLKNITLPRLHELRMPNHEAQEILDGAEIAPKGKIYFIVNRADLKPEQIKKLEIVENTLKPASNIQVVDYQQLLTGGAFKHLKDDYTTFEAQSNCITFEEELNQPGALRVICTVSKEHRVKLSSYSELSTQILPEDTPLMFQRVPLDCMKLQCLIMKNTHTSKD